MIGKRKFKKIQTDISPDYQGVSLHFSALYDQGEDEDTKCAEEADSQVPREGTDRKHGGRGGMGAENKSCSFTAEKRQFPSSVPFPSLALITGMVLFLQETKG